jgi:hypothetical protein
VLGTLSAVLFDPAADPRRSEPWLAALTSQTQAADADLRRRALGLLADPRLEPMVARLDPGFLVERLRVEEGREARLELLGLLKRFARRGLLGALLDLEAFDALCAEPELLAALGEVLERLVQADPASGFAAAERLIAARAEDTRLARLRWALGFVAGLDERRAQALESAEHAAVLGWVWRAVDAGVVLREHVAGGEAFELRVLELHGPRAAVEAPGALAAFEVALLQARLRADLFLGGSGPAVRGSKSAVEEAFARAHASAQTEPERWRVLRDRARFRAAANEGVQAMSDFRRLLASGPEAETLLGIPDLRSAVALLDRLGELGGASGPASAAEACDLLRLLIEREAWRSEPASVRMQDLREWGRAALVAADEERLRVLERVLSDLPLTQLEAHSEGRASPLWQGLTREPSWFQELLDLRARVRLGLRELLARG